MRIKQPLNSKDHISHFCIAWVMAIHTSVFSCHGDPPGESHVGDVLFCNKVMFLCLFVLNLLNLLFLFSIPCSALVVIIRIEWIDENFLFLKNRAVEQRHEMFKSFCGFFFSSKHYNLFLLIILLQISNMRDDPSIGDHSP